MSLTSTGDTCVRCLCDKEPSRPTDSETEALPETLKQPVEKPACLAMVNPDATLVASGAAFCETTGKPVGSIVLERASALDQSDAHKSGCGSVSTVRTVYARHSPTVMGSCYYGDDRNERRGYERWKEGRKRNSRCDSFYVDQDGGVTQDVYDRKRDSETRWGETSSGFPGGDSCPAVLSSGTVACGARERDSCTPAGNGSKPDQGTVGSLGTCGVASGLLAHPQPRQSTRLDRPPAWILDRTSGADVQREEGKMSESETLDLSPPYSLPVSVTDTEREQVIELLRNRNESLYLVKLKRKSKFLHVNKLKKISEPPTFTTPDPDSLH